MHNGGRQLRKLLRQFAKESTRFLEPRDDPLEVIKGCGSLLVHCPSADSERLLLEMAPLASGEP